MSSTAQPAVIRIPRLAGAFKKLLIAILLCGAIAGAVWQARRMYRTVVVSTDIKVPTTTVRRGDLTFTVVSKGELHGGNSEMLTAPLTGGGEMHITYLPKDGELVKAGDTVVEFDPSRTGVQAQGGRIRCGGNQAEG